MEETGLSPVQHPWLRKHALSRSNEERAPPWKPAPSPLPLWFAPTWENCTDTDTARLMFMEPNWKQLRRVGSQATPSWTTALLFVGGLACQGPIALPSLGPRSHPATRILHERRTPHPHAGPPRPAPSSLLRAPETALRAHRVSFKQHKERLPTQSNLRRGRSEHRWMPEVKMDKVWPHPCQEVKTAIIC